MLLAVGVKMNTTSANLKDAQAFADKMKAVMRPHAYSMKQICHYAAVFLAIAKGEGAKAAEEGYAALDAARKTGAPTAVTFAPFALIGKRAWNI